MTNIVGLIPCGGKAERLSGIPKFLLPVPGSTYLLAEMCRKLHMVKNLDWVYVCSGLHNTQLVDQYTPPQGNIVYRADSPTMCGAVLDAKSHTGESDVIFAMPDTYITDETIFSRMAAELSAGADIVVAAWMTRPEQRSGLGMVAWEKKTGRFALVDDKPERTALTHAWGALAWKANFYQYIKPTHTHLGQALDNAVAAGLTVKVVVAEGEYFDLGTHASIVHFYKQFDVAKEGVK